MAIEDAVVLATSLPPPDALSPSAIATSLAAYARARAARVDRVYKAARDNAFNYHLPQPLARLRELADPSARSRWNASALFMALRLARAAGDALT